MAAVGRRQRTTGTVPLTGTLDIRVRDCLGARMLLVMFSGGSNANTTDAFSAEGVEKDGTLAGSVGVPMLVVNGASRAMNKVYPEGEFAQVFYGPDLGAGAGLFAVPIPTPEVVLGISAGVGDVTGVNVDVWPIFDGRDNFMGSALPT